MKNYHKNIKVYCSKSEPLYTKEDFLYYFENRLQHIIREEVNSQMQQAFYKLPF